MDFNILLFDGFQTLDAFGPVDVLARVPGAVLRYCSLRGGEVASAQGCRIGTVSTQKISRSGVLLLPGGMGTRPLSEDEAFLAELRALGVEAGWVLSVCTGAALLARTGLLDGRRATSNKYSFDWVRGFKGPLWQPKARWCVDGKFYTASGVAAGIDMALGFVSDRLGAGAADAIARRIEYVRNPDPQVDPFAVA